MDRAVWSKARRLQSWPAPALQRAIAERTAPEQAARIVTRHPILDRRLAVAGYELRVEDAAADETAAAAAAIVSTLADIGLDTLVGARMAWVPVTRSLLTGGSVRLLPADRCVIQVTRAVAGGPGAVEHLRDLRAAGFRVALTDFVARGDSLGLLALADAVKLDAPALTADQIEQQVSLLSANGVETVFSGVDDHAVYDTCAAAGANGFQGSFFCEPRAVAGRGIPAGRRAQMDLVIALRESDGGLERLERAIRSDVGVGYRLLRFANSAYFSLPRRVGSVHEALVLLGYERVRNWALLMTLSGMNDQPAELTRVATVRAHMCEQLARALRRPDPEAHFTAGLFSVIDAFMGMRMVDVLDSLPLTPELAAALRDCDGPLGDVLSWVLRYEAGAERPAGAPAEAVALLSGTYLEALRFADSATLAAA